MLSISFIDDDSLAEPAMRPCGCSHKRLAAANLQRGQGIFRGQQIKLNYGPCRCPADGPWRTAFRRSDLLPGSLTTASNTVSLLAAHLKQ